MRAERGFTIVELMMGMLTSLVILGVVVAMVDVATRSQARNANLVATNQRARPVMTNLLNRLHSSCVAPGVAPVLAGSSDSSISFLSKSGSAVSPTPDLYVVSLDGGRLVEEVYPATGGGPPEWTFSGTPASTRVLLDGVTTGSVGDPPTPVPLFRYFAYEGGQLSPTPLPTPLSVADAASTVHVTIAFTASAAPGTVPDPNSPITLADSTTLRLEPASEDSAETNLPCV